MRKMLTILAVAMVLAGMNGCCCRRLCPLLDQGSCCCLFQQPAYAPVVAAPCAPACPPPCAPAVPQTYMTPAPVVPQSFVAAPCPQPCAPVCPPQPCCTKWDPCQCAIVTQQQPTCCPPQQPMCCPQPQPMCCPAPQPVYYSEPTCEYVEPGCGQPFTGSVGFGPSLCDDCGTCGGGGCDSGCCDGGCGEGGTVDGGVITAPSPESFVDPTPAPAE